ncbi:MAG: hypothetical protein PsegKO_35110 [Pseudohongiellaceae bacterium]
MHQLGQHTGMIEVTMRKHYGVNGCRIEVKLFFAGSFDGIATLMHATFQQDPA